MTIVPSRRSSCACVIAIAIATFVPALAIDVGGDTGSDPVDLSVDEYESVESADAGNADEEAASRSWFRRLDLSGFGAAGYYDAGRDSAKPIGGFEIREASLFLDFEAWTNVFLFFELQTNRLGADEDTFTRIGEVHVHLRDLVRTESGTTLGLKVGRFDIPFGEDYTWQDASDNPLVSHAAAWPYGWDEGILAYGSVRGLGWVASITDGADERSEDDDQSKAVNLKLHGRPHPRVYLSASAMDNGESHKSAIEFGGSHLLPVGAYGLPTTAGASPSFLVSSTLFSADAKIDVGRTPDRDSLRLGYGTAEVDDPDDTFDRDLRWWLGELVVHVGRDVYLAGRYSGIETDRDDHGYILYGKPLAGGVQAFGFDARRFTRVSLGAGWRATPNLLIKLELGEDEFEVIPGSPFTPGDDDRESVALELVVHF